MSPETICRRCQRPYEPEPTEEWGLCCICVRDLAYARVYGPGWRRFISGGESEARPAVGAAVDREQERMRGRMQHARAEAAHESRYHLVKLSARRHAVIEVLAVSHRPDGLHAGGAPANVLQFRLASARLSAWDVAQALAALRQQEGRLR